MMLLHAVSDMAHRAVKAMAMSLIAMVCVLVGLGFLTSALWMILVAWQDPLFAAQILGFGYVAVGLLLFGVVQITLKSASTKRPSHTSRGPGEPSGGAKDPVVAVIEGFLMGLDAGRRSARPHR